MKTKLNRGFSVMDPEKQRKIAAMGGRAAHKAGTAHEFTVAEARAAGKIGGKKSGGNFRNNPARASQAGRKGGRARAKTQG